MTAQEILKDLHSRFGARLVLHAADLALVLGESENAIDDLINTRGLPFKVKLVGRRRCVDIYQVADWLAHAGDGPAPEQHASISAAQPSSDAPDAPDAQLRGSGGGFVPDPQPAPRPTYSKFGEKILRMRQEQAIRFGTVCDRLETSIERLFALEVLECMLFAQTLPLGTFVLTRSTSDAVDGAAVVGETTWFFDSSQAAVHQADNLWWGDGMDDGATRLVLRQGQRDLFRGVCVGAQPRILVDLVGLQERRAQPKS